MAAGRALGVLLLGGVCTPAGGVRSASAFVGTAQHRRPARPRAASPRAGPYDDPSAPPPLIAVSAEFTKLCQAQFEVLASAVGASRCAVYFRREHPLSGALEFVPVAVYPETQSVWVVGQDGDLPSVGLRELPGCASAPSLIPDYPFVRGESGAASGGEGAEGAEGGCGLLLADGGVSFPLRVESVVIGVLAVWRAADGRWPRAARQSAAAVARSLAMAAMLDQRALWASGAAARPAALDAQLLSTVGSSLSRSLHQLHSPLSAVHVFTKLLLRTLPSDDARSRQLVREIVSQAARVQELLAPLESMAHQLPAADTADAPPPADADADPAGGGSAAPPRAASAAQAARGPPAAADDDTALGAMAGLLPVLPLLRARAPLWVGDVALPLLRASAELAAEQGAVVQWSLDEDAPPVLAAEAEVREALSNALDNALKHGTGLVAVSVRPFAAREEGGEGREQEEADGAEDAAGVSIVVWSSGPGVPPEQLPRLFEPGYSGPSARASGRAGSGLGLAILRELVGGLGGAVSVRNEGAPAWLAARAAVRERAALRPMLSWGTSVELRLPRAGA